MRWPPSLAAGHRFSPQKKRLARLVDEQRVVRDRAPVVVQVVRALGVGVVGARVDRQVALVVDDEVRRVEVVVLREVGPARELDPRGALVPSRRAARGGRCRGRAARRGSSASVVAAGSRGATVGSLPEELEHRVRPLGRQPRALLQQPRRVRVLEAVDRVAEHDVVARVEVRELVVVVARLAAVGQHLVEVASCPCCGRPTSGAAGSSPVAVRRTSAIIASGAQVIRM